jgi:tRNA-specific 2-thiouridylase
VIVGPREALMTSGLLLEELNWIGAGSLEVCGRCRAPLCSSVCGRHARPLPARLGWHDGTPVIWFDAPEEGVARGQAAVLYDPDGGTRILGGGFILKAIPADDRVAAA